jgi:glycosyltransferase involved in cell wall biosynthesis
MRFLVTTYYYAPWAFPAANRWAAMTKHLRREGHEVTIVTTTAPVLQGDSPGAFASEDVVRTADLNSNAMLRRLLRRPEATDGPSTLGVTKIASTSDLLTKVIVPDAYLLSWNPWARRAIRRLLHDRAIDCLITTGPPDSTHLLGLGLGRGRPTWIAEFRDGWLFEPLHQPFPTAPQRVLERWLERRVVTRADAVVGVTRPIVEDFRSRFGVPAELISNGWDPEMGTPGDAPPRLIDPDKFTFVHTGTISGAWGRNPRALVSALLRLVEDDPTLAERVEVLFVGLATAEDLELLGHRGLRGLVRHAGVVNRRQAFALQRAANTLLLITSDHISEATGKLFEYLGSGRPIIALAQGNEAARIVRETDTGVCVAPGDVEAIATQLRRAIDGDLEARYAPRGLDLYSYPGPAEHMAQLAEQVARGRRRATA